MKVVAPGLSVIGFIIELRDFFKSPRMLLDVFDGNFLVAVVAMIRSGWHQLNSSSPRFLRAPR